VERKHRPKRRGHLSTTTSALSATAFGFRTYVGDGFLAGSQDDAERALFGLTRFPEFEKVRGCKNAVEVVDNPFA